MRDPSRMRAKTYRYDEGTHAHPRALFRHSHGRRFRHAVRLLDVRPGQKVLDFGSGDGYLLQCILGQHGVEGGIHPEDLTGLEPMEFLQEQFRARLAGRGVGLAVDASALPTGGFGRIACLEVLEHLRPTASARTLDEHERLLAPDGVLVVSVPVEIGPSVLVKYLASLILTKMDRWYRPSEVLRATFGRKVARDAEGEFLSHKGYDHRMTRRELERRFRIESQTWSPLPWLGPVLNAQVFWQLRHRQPSG